MSKALGLYIHIPFCRKKCNYCDFYSLPRPCDDNLSEYVSALCSQLDAEASLYKDCIIDTIFLGGGTPSLLCADDIKRLFGAIRKALPVAENAEISIEANPDTITYERAMAWRECGINRLSIGLQSAIDSELCVLGRIHTLDDFERSYLLARECGFDNINIDIMYALPSQKLSMLEETLDYVVKLAPEHISAYCLKIEGNTPFAKMIDSLTIPSEDEQYEMYLSLCSRLAKAGYEQYEISNFARAGKRCLHNMKYWLCEEYIGLGPSAHSFFDGCRYFYEDSITKYISTIKGGAMPSRVLEESVELTKEQMLDEYVMLHMRLCDGVNDDELIARFGISFEEYYDTDKYIKDGYIIKKGRNYSFSTKGFFVSNYILSNILKSI